MFIFDEDTLIMLTNQQLSNKFSSKISTNWSALDLGNKTFDLAIQNVFINVDDLESPFCQLDLVGHRKSLSLNLFHHSIVTYRLDLPRNLAQKNYFITSNVHLRPFKYIIHLIYILKNHKTSFTKKTKI